MEAVNQWVPGQTGWNTFCKNHPELGYTGSRSSFIWFNRTYGEAMRDAGVMRKSIAGRHLINMEAFDSACFEHLSQITNASPISGNAHSEAAA